MASLARIAAVAQSWLDRKETLPEGDGLFRRRRHHRSGTSRVLEESHLPDSGGGCAAAANETGATMSTPSQRAGNDRSKRDPAAAAVPSEFARRGDLKGLSEGRPPFPAPPGAFRCRTRFTVGSAGAPRRRREEQQDSDIIGIPDLVWRSRYGTDRGPAPKELHKLYQSVAGAFGWVPFGC